MSVTFQAERWADIPNELDALFGAHWQEVAHFRDKIPLAPDWNRFFALEEAGRLALVTARKDGELIGYASFLIGHALHYRHLMEARNHLLYIAPEHRTGLVGYKLLRESVRMLREAGIEHITVGVKPERDYSRLLKRLGFSLREWTYEAYVGG